MGIINVEALGYLLIAKLPNWGICMVVYYVDDALLGEHNLLSLAYGVSAYGRDEGGRVIGSSGGGVHAGYLGGTSIGFVLATRGKGEVGGEGYESRNPQNGGVNLLIIILLSF